MDCPTEEALIRTKFEAMQIVQSLEFNLMQRVLTVVHQTGTLPIIEMSIRELGMVPEHIDSTEGREQIEITSSVPKWPLALGSAAAFAGGSEIVQWVGGTEWLSALFAIIAVSLSGISTYKKGWIALRHRNLNINALMSIAVTGALALRQWPEAAMVMVLFSIAEHIEAKSLNRARNAIRGLLQLTPELATVRQNDDTWIDIPAKSVKNGQLVRVKPGERIPLDGEVIDGQSSVNQASITGESLPVDKTVGDSVYAGTINESGSLTFRVTAEATNSVLSRIINTIEEAQSSRAPTQRFVDQFSKIYTPVVFALALIIAVMPPLLLDASWHDWVYRALVLLVIACPCALVISTPVTIVSGMAAAARHGILIKGGVYLEEGCKLGWLAFDKTGTITHGKPILTDTVQFVHMLDAVRIATSLSARSDHPVSRAITEAGLKNGATLLDVTGFAAIPGRGVRGIILGAKFQLGNHRLIHELSVCSSEIEQKITELEEQGKTVVVLADSNRVLVVFAVADTIKESSRSAIQSLHRVGIKTAMLTGDNTHTARAIAAQVGIDDVRGDLLPDDKRNAVADYARDGKVGMVGDGINDAPALARADIGFAMGMSGTDTAIETADVTLMDDDLNKVARFIQLSRKTRSILIQNITLALGIKAVFLGLTLFGMGTMWMAVFADMGASLLVVGNGLRLTRQ
jgi:Cd2+/Zn2+-exporting ATPase